MKISKRIWGSWQDQEMHLFDLEGDGLRISVSDCGALLQSLWVKNGHDQQIDAVLGYDTLQEYLDAETFFGAMIGPIADRMAEGRCCVDGKTVQFSRNAGLDCMHSGDFGFHNHIWYAKFLQDGVEFHRSFADGELGLPGCLQIALRYRIPGKNTLRIEYEASCDRETALSFTNHSYFTLNGGNQHCRDHMLTLYASSYAQTCREEDPICTGDVLPVTATPFDLREGRRIADILAHEEFSELRTGGGIDHYFPVDGTGMRIHAQLLSEADGLKLTCRSDAPGVLVYSANGLEAENGKGGRIYGRNWAACLETERFPNAVNQPHLRGQVLLQPGKTYRSATEFVFETM